MKGRSCDRLRTFFEISLTRSITTKYLTLCVAKNPTAAASWSGGLEKSEISLRFAVLDRGCVHQCVSVWVRVLKMFLHIASKDHLPQFVIRLIPAVQPHTHAHSMSLQWCWALLTKHQIWNVNNDHLILCNIVDMAKCGSCQEFWDGATCSAHQSVRQF